jgi:hypothetical protein
MFRIEIVWISNIFRYFGKCLDYWKCSRKCTKEKEPENETEKTQYHIPRQFKHH